MVFFFSLHDKLNTLDRVQGVPATEPVTHQRWREDPLKVIDVLDVLNRTVVYIYFSTNCLYYKVHIMSFSFSHITENDVNFCSYF